MEIVIYVELLLGKPIPTISDQLIGDGWFREKPFAVGRKLVSLLMTHAFLFIPPMSEK